MKKSRGMFGYVAVLLLMVLTISMLFTNGFGSNIRDRRITYPQLLTMIEEGQVRSVAIRGTSLVGVTTTTTVADADFPDKNYDFETTIGADFIVTARQMQAAKLNKPLDEVSVKDLPFTIIYRQPLTTPWWYDLIPLAISLVLCGVMFWLIMRAQTGGNGKVMNFGRSRARIHDPNKNKVTFADVASTNGETKKLDTPYLEYGTNSIIWDSITNADEYLIYVDDVYLTKTNHAYFDDFELSGKTGMLYIIASGDKSLFENSDISNKINLADLANVKSSYESKFLMINDTHGAFVDNQYPGVERLASLIKQLGDEYIKIANGDILQGSYISNILCGYPMIDALNNMNFNAYVIGNHEFDWGLDKIAEYKDGNLTNGEANFPFLGANIIDKKTNEIVDFLEPYTIIEKKDVRVGIIGLIGSRLAPR